MKESAIQSSAERYLSFLKQQGLCLYIKNNSGAMRVKDRWIRFGMKGSPDFLIFLPNGYTLMAEFKNETGKQSPSQRLWQEYAEGLGHDYEVFRSSKEFREYIDKLINPLIQ